MQYQFRQIGHKILRFLASGRITQRTVSNIDLLMYAHIFRDSQEQHKRKETIYRKRYMYENIT